MRARGRGWILLACADGMAYDDGCVPVGDLGVVVLSCVANRLLACLANVSGASFMAAAERNSRCWQSAEAARWEAVKRPAAVSNLVQSAAHGRLTAIMCEVW